MKQELKVKELERLQKRIAELLESGEIEFSELLEKTCYDMKLFSEKIKFLESHISSNLWMCTYVRNADGSDEMRYFKPSKKGNNTYSFLRRKRFKDIGFDLQSSFDLSQINESTISTNTFFVTLTRQYDRTNLTEEIIEESWRFFDAKLPYFMRLLKQKLNITKYAAVLEAHESGVCHAHIVVQATNAHECRMAGLKTRKTWRNDCISELVQVMADGLGFGLSDVQGCDNIKAISSYIAKELCKQGKSIEQAIKDYYARAGLKVEQIKALQTHYYSIFLKMRLLRTSKGLGQDFMELEEADPPCFEKFELAKSENTAGTSYTLRSATKSTGETVSTADYPRFLKCRQRNWKGLKPGEYFLIFRPWFGKQTQTGLVGFLTNYVDESTVSMHSDTSLLRQGLSFGFRKGGGGLHHAKTG